MTNPAALSDEQLEEARDLGVFTYLSSFLHLMTRNLGVDDSDNNAVNEMMLPMVEPINLATQAIWCSMVHDSDGMKYALEEFRKSVEKLGDR